MNRPLGQLAEEERRILQRVKDGIPYHEWNRGGRGIPSFHNPRKLCKVQKENKLMILMIKTQRNICVLCGNSLKINHSLRSDHPDRPSFDHVVSKKKGGKDRSNRIAAHRHCNSRKSDRDPTGCELLWLDVINLAIHKESHLFLDRRTERKTFRGPRYATQ